MSKRITINDVWQSDAGARLFNGISAMQLRDQKGKRVYFSQRMDITKRFIGMLLEGGLVPADLLERPNEEDDR